MHEYISVQHPATTMRILYLIAHRCVPRGERQDAQRRRKPSRPPSPRQRKPVKKQAPSPQRRPRRLPSPKQESRQSPSARSPSPRPRSSRPKKALEPCRSREKAELLSSEMVFEGPLFRVLRDRLIEPGGKQSYARHRPPQRQRGHPGHRQLQEQDAIPGS